VAAPLPRNDLPRRNTRAGVVNQKAIALNRGKSMSFLHTIRGINRFPNLPINTGMTKKKIIMNACAVKMTEERVESPNNSRPQYLRDRRMIQDNWNPTTPLNNPLLKYQRETALAFVEDTASTQALTTGDGPFLLFSEGDVFLMEGVFRR
jgi:hypothetical protein